jgi:hypothetical protein
MIIGHDIAVIGHDNPGSQTLFLPFPRLLEPALKFFPEKTAKKRIIRKWIFLRLRGAFGSGDVDH